MNIATYKSLSQRLEAGSYFEIDEFPDDKKPVVSAYLYGALDAGKVISLRYQDTLYSIKQTQNGLIDEKENQSVAFERLSNMLYDGARVRIKI